MEDKDMLDELITSLQIVKTIREAVEAQGGDMEDVRTILNSSNLAQEVAKTFINAREIPPIPPGLRHLGFGINLSEPVSHVSGSQFDIEKARFVPCVSEVDRYGQNNTLEGYELLKKADDLNSNLGLEDAVRFLQHLNENRVKPSEAGFTDKTGYEGVTIVFTGTIVRRNYGGECVPVVSYSRKSYCNTEFNEWSLHFTELYGKWYSRTHLVVFND